MTPVAVVRGTARAVPNIPTKGPPDCQIRLARIMPTKKPTKPSRTTITVVFNGFQSFACEPVDGLRIGFLLGVPPGGAKGGPGPGSLCCPFGPQSQKRQHLGEVHKSLGLLALGP